MLCGFCGFNRSKSACDRAMALCACEFGSGLLGTLSVLGISGFLSPTVFVALGAALFFATSLFRNLVSSLFAKKLVVLENSLISSITCERDKLFAPFSITSISRRISSRLSIVTT